MPVCHPCRPRKYERVSLRCRWTAELWLARFLCNFIAYILAISERLYTLFSYICTTVDSVISPYLLYIMTVDFIDGMATAILCKNYHTVWQMPSRFRMLANSDRMAIRLSAVKFPCKLWFAVVVICKTCETHQDPNAEWTFAKWRAPNKLQLSYIEAGSN